MPSLLRACLTVLAVLFLGPATVWAQQTDERRVALIIGNSNYERITSLDNPGNDAEDISVALEGLGFEVFLGLDTSAEKMIALSNEFAEAIKTADVSLFYFAGHGF